MKHISQLINEYMKELQLKNKKRKGDTRWEWTSTEKNQKKTNQ